MIYCFYHQKIGQEAWVGKPGLGTWPQEPDPGTWPQEPDPSQVFRFIIEISIFDDFYFNEIFPQHLVEGLLNFRRRVCRSFWLDLAFQDPPGKTDQ